MKTSSKRLMGIAVMAIALQVHAYPGESIVRDPTTGNYTITYVGESAINLSRTTFVPSTKIDPAVRSNFRLGERNIIMYRYTVSNGTTAKQAIDGVVIEQIANPILGEMPIPDIFQNPTQAQYDAYDAAVKAATAGPSNWYGGINRELSQVDWGPQTGKLDTNSIHAGHTLSGFGFNSLDLPGVATARLYGLSDAIFGFPDDGPVQDSAILDELNRLRDNDYVTRPAAVPVIAVPNPFDAALLLDRIRTEMQTWPGKQLLDPAHAAQLERYMVAAAEAYRLNNPKAAKEHIHTLRKMLAKEHRNLDHDDGDDDDTEERKTATRLSIDRLAARVLDFDLRYVLKRTEREHEEREGKKGRD